MTEMECAMARALWSCTFVPATGTKRFARDMAEKAEKHIDHLLTQRQRGYLLLSCYRFRKQIKKQPAGPELLGLVYAELLAHPELLEGFTVNKELRLWWQEAFS